MFYGHIILETWYPKYDKELWPSDTFEKEMI